MPSNNMFLKSKVAPHAILSWACKPYPALGQNVAEKKRPQSNLFMGLDGRIMPRDKMFVKEKWWPHMQSFLGPKCHSMPCNNVFVKKIGPGYKCFVGTKTMPCTATMCLCEKMGDAACDLLVGLRVLICVATMHM